MKINNNRRTKHLIKLILLCFIISSTTIIATTPLHEAAHWIMSDIDPYIKPVEFHVFDKISSKNSENMLPSALGCVIIEEKYPGAFNHRPFWADSLQEMICISIQVLISVYLTHKILKKIILKDRMQNATATL